ncbi:hypothetical protein KIP88_35490 [Bradyrhizobium sp. SRL28]|uniref:hypothetical protein n=1 Tax=Bradyrhizobium sp. SRL28 TaxID=2836178 RepID=UPI001BDEFA60|nr:hypothetical protein [Bradyrhizobium sp. SRL28]MBT1515779.1 hypothetical protein [Bradyrhizobium sp. SRL28]
MKAVLKMQINKNDRNDAIGIARIMQTGWFKEVHVKDIDSHSVRALLASRALLVKIKRDLENHVRGLLKNLGLVIGRATFNVFAARAEELIEDRPDLVAAVRPLLEARNAVEQPTAIRRACYFSSACPSVKLTPLPLVPEHVVNLHLER